MSDTLTQKIKKAKSKNLKGGTNDAPPSKPKKPKAKQPAPEPEKPAKSKKAKPEDKAAPESKPKKDLPTGELSTKTHRNGSQFTEQRPGVCAIIIEMWRKGSEKKPVSKAEVVEEILKRLPGRDEHKTKNLVGGAPSWLLTYNGIKVSSTTRTDGVKGYWIPASETEEVVRERLKKLKAK